jgi:hypothetical protein
MLRTTLSWNQEVSWSSAIAPQRRSQARRLLGQLKVTENAPDDGALRQVCQHPPLACAPWARGMRVFSRKKA